MLNFLFFFWKVSQLEVGEGEAQEESAMILTTFESERFTAVPDVRLSCVRFCCFNELLRLASQFRCFFFVVGL